MRLYNFLHSNLVFEIIGSLVNVLFSSPSYVILQTAMADPRHIWIKGVLHVLEVQTVESEAGIPRSGTVSTKSILSDYSIFSKT